MAIDVDSPDREIDPITAGEPQHGSRGEEATSDGSRRHTPTADPDRSPDSDAAPAPGTRSGSDRPWSVHRLLLCC